MGGFCASCATMFFVSCGRDFLSIAPTREWWYVAYSLFGVVMWWAGMALGENPKGGALIRVSVGGGFPGVRKQGTLWILCIDVFS